MQKRMECNRMSKYVENINEFDSVKQYILCHMEVKIYIELKYMNRIATRHI